MIVQGGSPGPARRVTIRRGESIARTGAPIGDVRILTSGACSVVRTMQRGLDAEGATLFAGDVCTFGTSLGARTHRFDVRALVDGEMLVVGPEYADSSYTQACRTTGSAVARRMSRRAACNALHPAAARLATWLCDLTSVLGPRVHVPSDAVAIALGAPRESAARALRRIAADGLLSYRAGDISVQDPAALRASACACAADPVPGR